MAVTTRKEAWDILTTYMDDEALLHHSLMVEGTLRYFADKLGHDADYWGVVGLLHDVDFQKWPEEHCIRSAILLKEHHIPDDIIRSVVSHGYGLVQTTVKPESEMEKLLFATDELTGIIHAAALMRPSKSVSDMTLKSAKKKYKSKSFAAGCSRDVIEKGADMLGWELDTLLAETLDAMKACEHAEAPK